MSQCVVQKDSTDILLFGGEYYDGKSDKMRVYNDIYVYHPDKSTWSGITSPNGWDKPPLCCSWACSRCREQASDCKWEAFVGRSSCVQRLDKS